MARGASSEQIDAILAVETNFIIGVVWEEQPILKRLMDLCRQFGVPIVIPEVALVEARASLLSRIDKQLTSLQQFRSLLNDIARGAGMARLVGDVKGGLDTIEAELKQSRQKAVKALEAFARSCTVVPLTPQIWMKAYLRWRANLPPFKELDCLVVETVLDFLRKRKAPLTMFLTTDTEDFDHPEVHEAFRGRKTLLLFDPRDVIHEFRKFYGVA